MDDTNFDMVANSRTSILAYRISNDIRLVFDHCNFLHARLVDFHRRLEHERMGIDRNCRKWNHVCFGVDDAST